MRDAGPFHALISNGCVAASKSINVNEIMSYAKEIRLRTQYINHSYSPFNLNLLFVCNAICWPQSADWLIERMKSPFVDSGGKACEKHYVLRRGNFYSSRESWHVQVILPLLRFQFSDFQQIPIKITENISFQRNEIMQMLMWRSWKYLKRTQMKCSVSCCLLMIVNMPRMRIYCLICDRWRVTAAAAADSYKINFKHTAN